ncbi:NCS2 family permease [Actinotignum schaalii]|uniref:NCS2 family permease n=1 Tax=Actinotignum schaalii TaxID=59505 RepID=UPI0003FBFB5F|nr:NCS2 family permease [Actinotignum schaalii]AIE82709.1 permease [Actinotignum schaalii]WQN44802.1 NCS2 family permease [Actinotignum schaalii]
MSVTSTHVETNHSTTSEPKRDFFRLRERGTTVARELRGGLVTFVAMAYILVLNPIILSGPDSTGAYLGGGTDGPNLPAIAAGTAIVAGLMTLLTGVIANFPLAMAAGLGLNTIVGVVIVQMPGMTWADGMGIIVIEGIVITLLVVTGLREAIFRAVPKFLRTAISVGLGLFITLVGLVNAGLIRPGEGTIMSFGINGSIASWPLAVFVFGLFLTAICLLRGVPGALLIGIVSSTIAAVIVNIVAKPGSVAGGDVTGWNGGAPALNGSPVQIPDFSTLGCFSVVGPFQKLGVISVVVLAFSVMLADFFDTMGTMVAVASEGDLLDEDGMPYHTSRILLLDSLAALAGGMGGVSSNTSFVESTTGVADGARTGLASVTTGALFLLSIFFAPLVTLVPSEAAAPALVAVGFLMMQQVTEIDWEDLSVGIPAFLTVALMPFSYSITVGIGVGFIAYVIMAVAAGKARKVHPLMWGTLVAFVIYFLLDPIQKLLLG